MKHEIDLMPFGVPNYVLTIPKTGKREDGFSEAPKFALSELSAETLDALCKQFRADVFIKAGKVAPAEGS
jgi:hypothetical protein